MSQQHTVRPDIKYQLLASFLGLLLIMLLPVFPPAVIGDDPWRKPVVGSIFSIICVLGVSAVFLPKKCMGILSKRKKNNRVLETAKRVLHGKSNTLQGHHPTCGNYETHIFWIKDSTFCAACVGLLLGGILAFTGAVAYFFSGWSVITERLLVWFGIVGVSFGLFQFKFRGIIRLAMNTIFVLGSLLILIGVDELVHSIFFDLFVISLIVFWLLTRISLSHWDHEIICFGCQVENCRIRE